MTDAALEARRAYKREWNRKNKDKIKAAQQRYWEKKAAAASTSTAAPTDEEQHDIRIAKSGQ